MANEEDNKASESASSEPAVSRTVLLTAHLDPAKRTDHVEVRKITILPGQAAGAHIHNCPVVGNILHGSAIYQIEGEPASLLTPGDVFYEPAAVPIARFDATDDGVTFLAYFLLDHGQNPEIAMVSD